MPNSIITQTRIADLGEPRIVVIGGGFGGLELVRNLKRTKAQVVLVDTYNRVTGFENIFTIGDVALKEGDEAFSKGHPQMAQPAMQQGKMVTKNILRMIGKQPLKPFHYFDQGSMATVGRNKAVVDTKLFKTGGFFAWCIWMFIHLVSITGFRNRVFTCISWIWSYISYDRSNRLIIGRTKEQI